MKRCIASAALTFLFVGANLCQAQQAITIKLKTGGEGDVVLVKKNETIVSKVTVTDAGGNVLVDQKENKSEMAEFTETTLKRTAGKRATKVQRAYAKFQTGADGKLEDSGLAGKSVLIERTGDKYEFTYADGEKLEGQALKALTKDFSKKSDADAELDKLVLPPGPVKVGDTWKIDMAKITKALSKDGAMVLDIAESTGKGTLIKAYTKNGKQFGEMKFKMEMPLVTIGKDKQQLKFAAGGKVVLDLTLDSCIDGTSEAGTMKMKMLMTGDATVPGLPGATAALHVTADATQIQQDAAKK